MSLKVLLFISSIVTVLVLTVEPFDAQVVLLNVLVEKTWCAESFWTMLACMSFLFIFMFKFDVMGHPGFTLGLEVAAVTFDRAAPVSCVVRIYLFITRLEITAITFEH